MEIDVEKPENSHKAQMGSPKAKAQEIIYINIYATNWHQVRFLMRTKRFSQHDEAGARRLDVRQVSDNLLYFSWAARLRTESENMPHKPLRWHDEMQRKNVMTMFIDFATNALFAL